MAKKKAARRGRPRQFGDREVISVAIPNDLLGFLDFTAQEAGVSRTRLIIELLTIAMALKDNGKISVDAEGSHYTSVPDPVLYMEVMRKAVAEGWVPHIAYHVHGDRLFDADEADTVLPPKTADE